MTRTQRIHNLHSELNAAMAHACRLRELEGADNPKERLAVATKLWAAAEEIHALSGQIYHRLHRAQKGGPK